MLRPTILFAILFSILIPSHAQSLQDRNLQEKNDTNYVLNAIRLGSFYQNSHLDSTLLLSEKAYFISTKLNYLKGQVYALNLEGTAFISLGNYSKALTCLLEALRISEKISLSKATAIVLTNLGALYTKQDEQKKALEYTLRAKEIFESLNDTLNLSGIYLNIGNYYEVMNLLDSASINTEVGRVLAQKVNDENGIGTALNNLGNIKAKAKQNSLAIEYYRLSFPYFINTDDYDGLCESYLGVAKVFNATNFNDSALYYARKSYSIAVFKKFNKFIYDASIFITQYYQSNHQVDSAFAYQQIMIAAKDSLFSQEKVKQLQNLTINETLRQQELAEEKLREAEERKNNLQYMAIASFIFLFALSIILISRRRIKLTTINFLVTVALLLIFEYISLFIHPYISDWTHHSPVYMLLILVVIAAILVPGHHRLEHWIKETLSHKIIHPRTRKMKMKRTEDSDEG